MNFFDLTVLGLTSQRNFQIMKDIYYHSAAEQVTSNFPQAQRSVVANEAIASGFRLFLCPQQFLHVG